MDPKYLLLLPLFIISCGNDVEVSDAEIARRDSISKIEQRRAGDSMKRKNPLLIVPPDSNYTGSYVDKYPNGLTKFTGFFRFGERHGQWVSFYPTGIPWSEMHYDKGLRHGPNVTYFENGNKRFEGFYKNDKQDSVWKYYDSTGKLVKKVLFRGDRLLKELPPDQ
jgi:hypothetical protein